ncbi:dTDP-4-dehydrorhamnose reductase [Rhodobacter ferrooxidans]|uniref:dTDP-4-dehydrorhamnose reductase n=1 Tax=Rhodobacter ferrooxidans TaxID=371731 RepID=C8S384_9RHOB|nr:dTDP-4-dehydrorhamnose reductase [Rhodobacter sp. SW2]EEW24566.1 dTDP-4-dehydrorhamnose reductase [Rhodobacter sp. SW2]
MRLLVFGQTGQVARELQRLAPQARYLGRDAADLAHPETLGAILRAAAPEAVINAAAYTAVDRAETERSEALLINGQSPAAMAEACAALGVPFVHISTDYVFDGSGVQPFRPTDPTGPVNHYGHSKLVGEAGVRASGAVHAVLRTSWVFSAHGTNFVKTMLRLAQTRDRLTVVADQHGGPTPAAAIARACLTLAQTLRDDPAKTGVYHFAGAPDTTWAGFAREVFAQARLAVAVEDISTSAFPTPAARPLNSRLDCTSTETTFGLPRPDWREGLRDVLKELEVLA